MLTRALVCPALVGRDDELRELVECRLAASRGHGSLVLISGDAGIGKSRLLVAFRKTLSGGRASVAVGLNRESGNPPYGAVLEAMRALNVSAGVSQARTRAEQLADLAERIAAVCSRRTTVLLLEDIHWADDGTLLFLQQLVPSIASLRLLVLATYRSDEVSRLEQLEPHLARFARNRATRSIHLRPLPASEMRRLIKLAAGQSLPLSDVVEEIVERSDGNPFFAEELLRNAVEDAASMQHTELPRTVRATVLERVAGLDDRSREILSRAAVLGRRFDASFLSDLCALAQPAILAALRRLRNLQLIDELAADPPTFVFRHALTQQTIYGDLLAAERKPLHARILSALEQRGADVADLGYHAWAAGNSEKAVLYNERAGDQAQALHVYGEAVRCYDRALALAGSGCLRGRLLEKSAASCASDGKAVQSVERYSDAARAYADGGVSERSTEISLAMSAQARISGDNERGVRILEKTLSGIDPGEPKERARVYINLAYLRLDRGEVREGKVLLSQAARVRDTIEYRNAQQYAELVAGDIPAFRVIAAATASLDRSRSTLERLRGQFNRGFGFAILGCDDEALEHFDALLSGVREARLGSLEILACANAALIHTRAGRLSEGRSYIERAAAIPEPTTTGPIALAAAALTTGFALWDEDLVARLCSPEIVEAAFSSHINSTLGRIAGPYARWLFASGDAAQAREVLRRAMEWLGAPFGATETLIAAAELGDEDTRLAAFAQLDALDAMSAADVYAATAHHLRALRATHSGDQHTTGMQAAEAQVRYVRLGWAMHEAACLLLCGDVKRASARYRRLHAAGPLRQIRSEAELGRSETPVLSEREREIASLVAHGTVNKHIAERLCVNQRTVEKHLTSIYEKLGLRNRSELAAYVTRNRLTGAPPERSLS